MTREEAFTGWRKSSYSSGNSECVAVAVDLRAVGVRDSTQESGLVLEFPTAAWRAFIAGAKSVHA
jgi:hypothetical protein